jgi:hypothetical protein
MTFHRFLIGDFGSQQEAKQHVAGNPANVCASVASAERRDYDNPARPVLPHGRCDVANGGAAGRGEAPWSTSQRGQHCVVTWHRGFDGRRVEHAASYYIKSGPRNDCRAVARKSSHGMANFKRLFKQ